MKNKHILTLLDTTPRHQLSRADLSQIHSHIPVCERCRRAFEASEISVSMLQMNVRETFEPPPFFQAKVMAALREVKVNKPVAAFWRWWQASGAMVSAMMILTAILFAVTLFAPRTGVERAAVGDDFSAEKVILNQENLDDEITTSQALQIIYEPQVSY